MKYSPRHEDTLMRAIYGVLVIAAFVMMSFGTGIVRAVLLSASVVCLGVGLYLFMRHDLTTYTYIVMENEGRLDFYVDKSTGKRGAYVCYYPLCDAIGVFPLEKGAKKELSAKHGKVFFYNYSHNRFCQNKYVVLFQNDGYCDGVICQLDSGSVTYIERGISLSKGDEE